MLECFAPLSLFFLVISLAYPKHFIYLFTLFVCFNNQPTNQPTDSQEASKAKQNSKHPPKTKNTCILSTKCLHKTQAAKAFLLPYPQESIAWKPWSQKKKHHELFFIPYSKFVLASIQKLDSSYVDNHQLLAPPISTSLFLLVVQPCTWHFYNFNLRKHTQSTSQSLLFWHTHKQLRHRKL